LRDLAALNMQEMMPWDYWGPARHFRPDLAIWWQAAGKDSGELVFVAVEADLDVRYGSPDGSASVRNSRGKGPTITATPAVAAGRRSAPPAASSAISSSIKATIQALSPSASDFFNSLLGIPLKPNTLTEYCRRLFGGLGRPDLHFHSLRHSFATVLLEAGVSPRVAQQQLGHANVSMTLGTYSHVTERLEVDAAQRVDHVLRKLQ
jgi:hypothetical protein